MKNATMTCVFGQTHTWVHRVGGHAFALSDASQLQAEVNVGQLATAVGEEGQQVVVEVLEVQFLVLVGGTGESDHAARCALYKARQQQVGEEEVTKVVDPKAHAEAIVGPVENAGHACTETAAR